MKRYKIEKTCSADKPDGQPVLRKAGSVVAESDILPGCLVEMVRLGMATEYVEPESPKVAPPAPTPVPPAPIKAEKPVKLKAEK